MLGLGWAMPKIVSKPLRWEIYIFRAKLQLPGDVEAASEAEAIAINRLASCPNSSAPGEDSASRKKVKLVPRNPEWSIETKQESK